MTRFLTGIFFLWASLACTTLFSQQWVSTQAQGKKVIIEAFTGVRCGVCPQAHQLLAGLMADHPGEVWVVGLHPRGDWHTEPLSPSDPDLRHGFANNFFHSGTFGGTIYMPSAMVNRRQWTPNVRAFGREHWTAFADSILQEMSPVNVGARASYDSLNEALEVEVEVYYTAPVSRKLSLYVMLLEDSIAAGQAGQGPDYLHFHVLRAAITGTWGAFIADSAGQGTLWARSYRWNAAAQEVQMKNAKVLVYVREEGSGELLSGAEVPVLTVGTTSREDLLTQLDFQLAPNPVRVGERLFISLPPASRENRWQLLDLMGRVVAEGKGTDLLAPAPGYYVLRVSSPQGQGIKKIWIR